MDIFLSVATSIQYSLETVKLNELFKESTLSTVLSRLTTSLFVLIDTNTSAVI